MVRNVSLSVNSGEIVGAIGANGVGKTTLLKGITRSLRLSSGRITFDGEDVTDCPKTSLAAKGIGYVPQSGNVFPELTVMDNLLVSSRGRETAARRNAELILRDFPRLSERRAQFANTLSGGERQMPAIASALLSSPRLLILDEPTTGLAPMIVADRISDIKRLRENGTAVLWVIEEHPRICLPAVDRVHFMADGHLLPSVPAGQLLERGALESLFFGVKQ